LGKVLEISSLSKKFDDYYAIKDISLIIEKNEFVTLLGPSGCGKTTLLRMIGGFETPTAGDIYFSSQKMTNTPPHLRPVNTVFQRYALFPHMNVFNNIAFGLRIRRVPPGIIRKKVSEILKLVKLSGYEERSPQSLSGGQQQRVAIARALINEPQILLLDEPLGALDLKLRKEMQAELKRIQRTIEITFIFVTHDQEEALSMSDRILVLNNGSIEQTGTPQDIYNEPKNSFVADFIGESNIFKAIMKKDFLVHFLQKDLECLDKGFAPNENVEVLIRPEDILLTPYDPLKTFTGEVKSVLFMGVHYEIIIDIDGTALMVHSTDNQKEGSMVSLDLDPDDIHVMKVSHA
jgi:spermidine/putrescine transport system ATP-binding protein